MRLIDADALKTSIYNYANEQVKLNDRRWDSKCTAIIVDMHGIVVRAPTVDAKPVKTAQLIRETDRERHWHCSRCGKVFGLAGLMYKYCPECGAQMIDRKAQIVPLSRIFDSLGFGWLEDHYTDDQGVEGRTLYECVWIYGLIIDTDGCRIDKDYTRSHYGKPLGLRVWDSKPTEAQMQEAEWHD